MPLFGSRITGRFAQSKPFLAPSQVLGRLHKNMATLVVEREIFCPPALAVARIYRAFGAEGLRETMHTLHVPFADLGLPNVGAFHREVLVTLGEPQRRRALTRIPLTWRVPDGAVFAFPMFKGFFEVQPLSSREIQLALLGYYHPPFGAFGVVFDAALGHRIAEVTVGHLMDEVCTAIKDDPVLTSDKAARLG